MSIATIPCEFSEEVRSAIQQQRRRAHEEPEPELQLAYFQTASILTRIDREHYQRCRVCQAADAGETA